MELLCAERVSPSSAEGGARPAPAPRAAAPDPVLMRRRVLDNLLRTEERYAVTSNYFGTVQTEVTPHMRRVVAEWMLEVSAPAPNAAPTPPAAVPPARSEPFAILSRFPATCGPSPALVDGNSAHVCPNHWLPETTGLTRQLSLYSFLQCKLLTKVKIANYKTVFRIRLPTAPTVTDIYFDYCLKTKKNSYFTSVHYYIVYMIS